MRPNLIIAQHTPMKTRIILTLVTLLIAPPGLGQQDTSPAARADLLYRQGLAAVQKGDKETAQKAFEGALRINPGHANARYHLLQLRGTGERLAAKARQLKLQQVKLPVVNFDNVTLEEAVQAIDLLVRKETKETFAPNFVIQDSSGELAKRPITLQLRNVPAHVALKYTLDLARATVRYDEHAILIQPLGAPKPKTAGETGSTTQPEVKPFE